MWRIFRELRPPKSKSYTTPPPLMASVFSAIINGTRYPEALLENVIRRVKTDRDDKDDKKNVKVNYVRAGIIKACINRKDRYSKNKEEIKMALDIENNNQAYLCGRLLAVAEKIQMESVKGGDLNRTVKDTYFSSACANPAKVFPNIMKLEQYHLEKIKKNNENGVGYAIRYSKIVSEIMDKINYEFPKTLSLDEQGKFIIGYYHQEQAFYKKKETNDKEI